MYPDFWSFFSRPNWIEKRILGGWLLESIKPVYEVIGKGKIMRRTKEQIHNELNGNLFVDS